MDTHNNNGTHTPTIAPVVTLTELWDDRVEAAIRLLGEVGGHLDAAVALHRRWVASEPSGMVAFAKYAPLALADITRGIHRARRGDQREKTAGVRVVVAVRTNDGTLAHFDVDIASPTWLTDFSRRAFAEVHALGEARDAHGCGSHEGEVRDGRDVDGVHGAAAGGGRCGDGVRAEPDREGTGGAHAKARGTTGPAADSAHAAGGETREAQPV